MNYLFRGEHHPAASGRQPEDGDELFKLLVPTDDGRLLNLELGRRDFIRHAACISAVLMEDEDLAREVIDAFNGKFEAKDGD